MIPTAASACSPTAEVRAYTRPAPAAASGGGFRLHTADGLHAVLLDEVAVGLLACDRHGGLRFANQAARQELASQRSLLLCAGSLRCADGRSAALDRALRQTATKGRRQLLTLGAAANRLMVTLIPLAQDSPLARDEAGLPLVLLVLGRRGACSALGLEMLAAAHGLTFAERRVLCGLVGEVSPRDIAEAGGVALSTVRTQIAAIRTKFGVRNIEGLLIRAAEVPPMPSALLQRRLVDLDDAMPPTATWTAVSSPLQAKEDHHAKLQ